MRTHRCLQSFLSGVGLVVAASLGAPRTASAEPPPHEWFQSFKARYLDGLFGAKPHLATFMGDHRFDDKLPDLAPAALTAREAELTQVQTAIRNYRAMWQGKGNLKASDARFPLDDRIDAEILDDGVALELLYLREIHDWTWDPRLHDSFPSYDPREIVAGRLSDIVHGDFAPEAERRKSVNAQLLALPRFLAQMKAALKNPPRVYTEQAIRDNKGRIEFFDTELKEFTTRDAASESARKSAVAALADYQSFLEKDLLARSGGDWRLGAALYAKKFPLALQTRLTPAEVIPRAELAFLTAKKDCYAVARRLYAGFWPKEPVPAETADAKTQAATIARVRDELGKEHPDPVHLVAAHAQKLEGLRAFIEKNQLVTLPPVEALRVEAMPAFKRGSSAAEYLAPGILEHRGDFHATYYVDPVDPSWPKEKVDSFIRSQNDTDIELTAAHEAYPGHHTQFSYERRDLNALRATLWNAAMVEGWAVYGTTLLTRLGYGGARADRYRFMDLIGAMRVDANVLLDIKLQTGAMTDAEAIRFMVEDGFQEPAMAEKKLLRAKLDSTQLAQYYLGVTELDDLEQAVRKQEGKAFRQHDFDEAVIGHGSIAVKFLRAYLLKAPVGK